MATPARVDLGADRFVAFIETLVFFERDLTGATFAMQVRTRKDGGTIYADLATVASAASEGVRLIYAGTDTIANHIAADRLLEVDASAAGYDLADSVLLSEVGIRINETTMEAMPWGEPRGEDEVLYWDLHVTPAGGLKTKEAGGTFTVLAGVTE